MRTRFCGLEGLKRTRFCAEQVRGVPAAFRTNFCGVPDFCEAASICCTAQDRTQFCVRLCGQMPGAYPILREMQAQSASLQNPAHYITASLQKASTHSQRIPNCIWKLLRTRFCAGSICRAAAGDVYIADAITSRTRFCAQRPDADATSWRRAYPFLRAIRKLEVRVRREIAVYPILRGQLRDESGPFQAVSSWSQREPCARTDRMRTSFAWDGGHPARRSVASRTHFCGD